MDIYFTYEIGACDQFREKDGEKETVTIVVAPLRIEGTDTTRIKVVSGCNMFQGCLNPRCYYSSASRQQPKMKPRKE